MGFIGKRKALKETRERDLKNEILRPGSIHEEISLSV